MNPTKIEFFSEKNLNIKNIVCGSNFTFVLDANDFAYSFGDNSNGQLARNTQGNSVNPFPDIAEYLQDLGLINKICCGWSHGIMSNYAGEVFVWGNYFNDYKKICDLDDIIKPKKVEIPIDDCIKEVYDDNDQKKFQKISIEAQNSRVIDICTGFNHLAIIVLRSDNKSKELYTWGANEFVCLKFQLFIISF